MKNIMKKIVAFLCVLTLSVGAMAAWTPAKEVKATEASTEPTPVYLEGFKHVTLEDFDISKEVTFSEEDQFVQMKDHNGTAVAGNFDKTLLSLNVDFTDIETNNRSALIMGGSDNYKGFAFSPNYSGTAVGIINYWSGESPMNDDAEKYQPGVLQASYVNTALGRTDFSFLEPFTLQVSFEYTMEGEETYLTLVFYINGKQIEIEDRTDTSRGNYKSSLKMKVTNSLANHGNYIGYRKEDRTLKLSSVVPVNDKLTSITWSDFVATKAVGETVYLPEFKQVTLSDFTNSGNVLKENEAYSTDTKAYSLKDIAGATVGDLDNTLVSFNIKYTGAPILLLGGNAENQGIGIVPSGSGQTLQFVNYNNNKTSKMLDTTEYVFARVNVNPNYSTDTNASETAKANAAYNVEQLKQEDKNFNFLNTEFLLQLSFDYYDSDSNGTKDKLKLGVYVNGKLMKLEFADKTTTDKEYAKLDEDGKVEAPVYYYDVTDTETNVTISKSNHGTYIQLVSMATNNITLSSTKITLPNKAFLKSSQEAYKLQDSDLITQLGNTSFEGKITFLSDSDNDVIYYGGGEVENGLRFSACEEGSKLKVLFDDDELYLDAATAGVTSFLNNEFRLNITTEYADYDVDGDSDDVQLGILINGKLYNNKYLYVYDYTTAGNYVTIESDEKGIMLRSVTTGLKDVTYDLSQGPYNIATDFHTVTKVMKGNTEMTFDTGLSVAGDYTLHNENELVGEVILYQAGDVHPDSETDVRDLVAMMKVNANVAFDTWAGTMGAYKVGFSETEIINNLLSITEQ